MEAEKFQQKTLRRFFFLQVKQRQKSIKARRRHTVSASRVQSAQLLRFPCLIEYENII